MLLTLTLSKNWTTRQVDYTNAFAQAKLNEQVYVEPPRGFLPKGINNNEKVLHLQKSLYGLRQAPKTFFDKLSSGLKERGFKQSAIDPCLFFKNQMICVVYVDDTIIAGPDGKEIEKEIHDLGVSKNEQQHKFELRNEGEVGDFLGIRIKKTGHQEFLLSQPGLIEKVIKEAQMEDCNTVGTPAITTALGKDELGEKFDEPWEYATIVGMLLYLSGNSRPDIAFAVNQCARFTHCPRKSHAVAIKRILRYLKGTSDKGLILKPEVDYKLNCYVDADFAGLWGKEDDQDPVSVKSRSGFLITFMGCPIVWSSKLQTQIALSTMEAEYISLSNSMRELISLRETLKEFFLHVLNKDDFSSLNISTSSKGFYEIQQTIVHKVNNACLKFVTMPKLSPRIQHIAIP